MESDVVVMDGVKEVEVHDAASGGSNCGGGLCPRFYLCKRSLPWRNEVLTPQR